MFAHRLPTQIGRPLVTVSVFFALSVMVFACLTPDRAVAKAMLCPASKHEVATDLAIKNALIPALGDYAFGRSESDCIHPFKVLQYETADVLFTSGTRDGACHGCSANVSAYVLAHTTSGRHLVSKLANFTTSGSWGTPGNFKALKFGSDDGLVIEDPWGGGGGILTSLRTFVFRQGGLAEIKFPEDINISYSNAGFETDPNIVVTIDGKWSLNEGVRDTLFMSFDVSQGNSRGKSELVFRLDGSKWDLIKGKVLDQGDPLGLQAKQPVSLATNRPPQAQTTAATSSSASETSQTSDQINKDIRTFCDKKWDDNYEMVLYCVKNQKQAVYELLKGLNGDHDKQIAAKCLMKWTDGSSLSNWEMTKYCYENQVKAFNELSQ